MSTARRAFWLGWFAVLATLPGIANAQFSGGGFGGGNGNGNGNGNGGQRGAAGGIAIDTQGVLRIIEDAPVRRDLAARRAAAVREVLPQGLTRESELRCVSLVRLERACERYAETGTMVPEDLRYLAGLQRIDFVFVNPDAGDLIIAGPAGAFGPDSNGRITALESGRPVLRLDDLLVALRTVPAADRVGVSIDPVPGQLAAMQDWVKALPTARSVAEARSRYPRMAQILGLQEVTIWGVPPDSHFAQVMVEADVRMKRVSLGLENPRLRGFLSHLAMVRPGSNSLRRWWFTPLYDAVYREANGQAFQFAGPRAQLLSQEEFADEAGRRRDAAVTPVSTERFSKQFTERFPELARQIPVFAELQNLMDLSVLAALIRLENLDQRVGWSMQLFLDESRATISSYPVPRSVPSIFNTRSAGRRLVIGLIAGGVTLDVRRLTVDLVKPFPGGATTSPDPPVIPSDSDRWWWDTAPNTDSGRS